MRASIYARYSSENQRKESIEDQILACRRHAEAKGFVVLEAHIYSDYARSGASFDRPGLLALLAAAKTSLFDVLLVDDLSRLARDTTYMLVMLGELQFHRVRVISVADHLDTADEESTLAIQLRGMFNELQLSDLRKKTFRGQLGQKERGFFVGERTYGYRSQPYGEVRIDKRGRPRPEGYKMYIEPSEAAIVRRIFEEFAAGVSIAPLTARFNAEGVPHAVSSARGWTVSTLSRILQNRKYIGVWAWNCYGTTRDPRTGRRRKFRKPKEEHVVHRDESLRIIPQDLWDAVQARRKEVGRVWPGGNRRGFPKEQGSRSEVYPTHLLDGLFRCSCCQLRFALVSGRRAGYYGCAAAKRRACDNRLMLSRAKAERIFLRALRDRLLEPGAVRYALRRVADEIAKLSGDVADAVRRKKAELADARKRLNNLVDFVSCGHVSDSAALASAIAAAEARASRLQVEVDALGRTGDPVFSPPSEEWIVEQVGALQRLLERRTPQSATVLRRLLGKVVLEPVRPESGRPYYIARTAIDTFVLIDPPGPRGGPDGGAPSLRWWRRRESNPRPKVQHRGNLHAYPPLNVSLPASKGGGNRRKPSPDASRRRVSVPRATASPLYDA